MEELEMRMAAKASVFNAISTLIEGAKKGVETEEFEKHINELLEFLNRL